MRKMILGGLVALTLVAGQAVAAGASAPLSVGDRVGPLKGSLRGFTGGYRGYFVQNPLLVAGAIAAAIAIPVAISRNNNHDAKVVFSA